MTIKKLGIILTGVAILLSIPIVAMQFTNEVNWSIGDFASMGVLLLGAGFLAEYILRKVKPVRRRNITITVMLIVFILFWAELAVGIFGTPFAGS